MDSPGDPSDLLAGVPDPRLFAPATQRNRVALLETLSRVLPGSGTVLEIASGTGEHAAWFAQQLRPLVWQPSDPDPAMRQSIAGHAALARCPSLRDALDLDVTTATWPLDRADAIVCVNMIHIAPWAAAQGLMAGAGRVLDGDGVLFLYGPYRRDGTHTAPSNASFDASLRAQNPAWGVRDLETVTEEAARHGLALREVVEMPANNLSVIYVRSS